jgi:hypothetical protein
MTYASFFSIESTLDIVSAVCKKMSRQHSTLLAILKQLKASIKRKLAVAELRIRSVSRVKGSLDRLYP